MGEEFDILLLFENEIVVILRKKYIPNYYRIHPSYIKLVGLLSICNTQLYKKKSIIVYKKNCSFFLYEFVYYMYKEYLS